MPLETEAMEPLLIPDTVFPFSQATIILLLVTHLSRPFWRVYDF
jgi:hypothetical protein